MDALDGRLLGHLVRDPLAGTNDLCDAVGLTPNAVRARLRQLRERGILWGTRGVPNPVLFSKTSVVAVYDIPEGGNPPHKDLLEITGVTAASRNYDGRLAAICWIEGPDAPTPPGLDEAMGAGPARRFVEQPIPLAPPGTELSPAKWRVMAELVPDPRLTTSDLADRAGTSSKQARRLRRWLVDGNHLKVETILQEDQAGEVSFHELYIQGPAASEPAIVQSALKESWVISKVNEPLGVLLLCRAEHLGEALASRDRVAGLDGVEHTEIVLGTKFAYDSDGIREMCLRRAEEAWPADGPTGSR